MVDRDKMLGLGTHGHARPARMCTYAGLAHACIRRAWLRRHWPLLPREHATCSEPSFTHIFTV